jgi:hypothetical protein
MVSDKVRRIEEKGFNPKTLEEEYKRKKLRVNEYFDDREEGEWLPSRTLPRRFDWEVWFDTRRSIYEALSRGTYRRRDFGRTRYLMDFMTSFPKKVLEAVISQYFKNLGVLSPQQFIDLKRIEIENDEAFLEADLKEEVMNWWLGTIVKNTTTNTEHPNRRSDEHRGIVTELRLRKRAEFVTVMVVK